MAKLTEALSRPTVPRLKVDVEVTLEKRDGR